MNFHFQVTVSIGITPLKDGKSQSPTRLIEMADKALYQAKKRAETD